MTKEEYEKLQNTSIVDKPLTTKTEEKQPTLQNTATQQVADSMDSHIPDSAQKQAAGISTAISAKDAANTEAGKIDANPQVKQGRSTAAKIDPIDNKEKEKFYTTQTADDLRKAAFDKAIQANDMSSIAMMYKGMDDATKAKWQDYVDAATKKNSALNNKAAQTADVANGDFTKETDYKGKDRTKTGDDMGQKTQNSLDAIHERNNGQTPTTTSTEPTTEPTTEAAPKKGIDWSKLWTNFKDYMNTDLGGGGLRGYYLLDAIGKGAKNYGESWRGGPQEDTAYNINKAKQTGGNIENKLSASKIMGDTAAKTQANINKLNTYMNSNLNNLSADDKRKLTETLKMANSGKVLSAGDYANLLGNDLFGKIFGAIIGGD